MPHLGPSFFRKSPSSRDEPSHKTGLPTITIYTTYIDRQSPDHHPASSVDDNGQGREEPGRCITKNLRFAIGARRAEASLDSPLTPSCDRSLTSDGESPCPPPATSWEVTGVRPQQLLSGQGSKAIQIRAVSGAVYVLEEPRVQGDSLTGYVTIQLLTDGLAADRNIVHRLRAGTRRAERRIALAAVDRVGVKEFNGFKTLGMLLLGGAAVVGVGALIAVAAFSRSSCCFGYGADH